MTDFFWPTSLVPARSEVKLLDLSTRFRSPFTGTSRAYARPGGDILSLSLQMPPVRDADAGALTALLAQLRGGVHRVWCQDHSYVKRGSFPAAELLANNTFASGIAGWTALYSSISAADRALRVSVSAHSAGQYPQATQGLTVAAGSAYVGRAVYQHRATAAQNGVYITDGTAGADKYITAGGMTTASFLAVATGGVFSAAIYDTSAAGDSVDLAYTSLSRCALIKGASQTSNVLTIDALPASTNGLLLTGDRVQLGEEMLFVIAPLDSNSSGEGKLFLHRPPRTAPADNGPVIIHEPMGLFMLAEQENGWLNDPGRTSTATVNLVEAIR
jgi:hypothetical protein